MLIKVESIKMELDSMLDKMHAKVEEEKKINKEFLMNKMRDNLEKAEDCLKQTSKNEIKMNSSNKKSLYDCLDSLSVLKELDSNLMNELHRVKFEPSESKVDDELSIGNLLIEDSKLNEQKNDENESMVD